MKIRKVTRERMKLLSPRLLYNKLLPLFYKYNASFVIPIYSHSYREPWQLVTDAGTIISHISKTMTNEMPALGLLQFVYPKRS